MPKENKDVWPIITTLYPVPNKPGNFFAGQLNEIYKDFPTSYDKLMKNLTERSSFYLRKATTSKGGECYHLCLRPPFEGQARSSSKDDSDDADVC